ncbi:MAG TPA: hypothetical protein EYG79_01575 [Rhodobacteraceae bacterium]|nr:hypothetical protein [Paracoccaceae bacterium]
MPEPDGRQANLINKLGIWVFGPIAVWLVIVFLMAIPFPFYVDKPSLLNWASLALGASLIYYLALGPRLGSVVILYWLVCIWIIFFYGAFWPRWQFYSAMVVTAWIGQFWRQKVEGNNLGIFKDAKFLLIGPTWLIGFLYKRLGNTY